MAAAEPGSGLWSEDMPYLPTNDSGSEFLMGNVSVGVFLLESNASNAPAENTENWNATEIQNVKNEILDSFHWWEKRAADNNTVINFNWEWNVDVKVSLEPIGHDSVTSDMDTQMWVWVDEATDSVGFNESGYKGVRDYINDLRYRQGTHWSFAIFVADSSNDSDQLFADDEFAFAYLGGPFFVMTYGNQNYGIENMDAVAAHETGHIFFALDEYAAAKEPKDSRSGYLNVPNQNSEYGGVAEEESIMRGGIEPYTNHDLSVYARGAVGWWDTDNDTIPDIQDTHPETTLNFSGEKVLSAEYLVNGTARVQPLENRNPKAQSGEENISLNTITAVEYSVDGEEWIRTTKGALDGAFDEQVEEFVIPVFFTDGNHTLRVRAVNNVGNVDQSPVEEQLTVDLGYAPTVNITFPTRGLTLTKTVSISWETEDSDGWIESVSLYYVNHGNDSLGYDMGIIVEDLPGDSTFYLWRAYSELGLPDGEYSIIVTAVDNGTLKGSDSIRLFLNNPDGPRLKQLRPDFLLQWEDIILSWQLRDNDVKEDKINDSFLFDIDLILGDDSLGDELTGHIIHLYQDMRPDHIDLNFSLSFGPWKGDEDPPVAFNNWTLSLCLDLDSRKLPLADHGSLPANISLNGDNVSFRAPDASYLLRVTVRELSTEAQSANVSSPVFPLDNPDPPVVILEISGSRELEDHYILREELRFFAGRSYDPDANNTEFLFSWDFGDGEYLNETSSYDVKHRYQRAGNYTVTVLVDDLSGYNSTLEQEVTVHLEYPISLGIRPVEEQQWIGWLWEDQELELELNISRKDFFSEDFHYNWSLHKTLDNYSTLGDSILNDTGESFSLMFQDSGNYSIILRGFDPANDDALFDQANFNLSIKNRAPEARTLSHVRVNPGEDFTLDGSGSTDSPSDLDTLQFSWYLSSEGSGEELLVDNLTLSYSIQDPGNYLLILKVTDNDGNSSTAMVDVTVNLYAINPSIQVKKTAVSAGVALVFTVDLFMEEPEPGFLESEFVKGLSFSWEFGDGSMASGKQVSHAFGSNRTYTVSLRIEDNDTLEEGYTTQLQIEVMDGPRALFSITGGDGGSTFQVGESVGLDATTSSAGAGDILMYRWELGDGSTLYFFDDNDPTGNNYPQAGSLAQGVKITHTYQEADTYTVTLTVFNGYGAAEEKEDSVLVKEKDDGGTSGLEEFLSELGQTEMAVGALVLLALLALVLKRGKRR